MSSVIFTVLIYLIVGLLFLWCILGIIQGLLKIAQAICEMYLAFTEPDNGV